MTHAEKELLFTEWVEVHSDIVVKVARAFAYNDDDTKDLIQDILVQIWSTLSRYREEARPATWIYRIALNKALNWQRSERARRQKHQPLLESVHYHEEDPKVEMLNRIYEEIKGLKQIDRALMLLFLDGFTYKEISETMEISESNVGVRLSRAKKLLMCRLGEDSNEL